MNSPLQDKIERLHRILHEMRGAAIAFSGGVDSTVVAVAAYRALGDQAVAVTADSPSVPRQEIEDARRLARHIGIRHVLIATNEFLNADYVKNDGSRCFFCKDELYSRIAERLPEWGVEVVCSGANLDDLGDYRPGLAAAANHRVRHPLQEAGLSKAEVRELARRWQLPNWDKPAGPCLSSRIAPGLAVTPQRTAMIEAAESLLHGWGFRECRVRLHEGELARIEVPVQVLARLLEPTIREPLNRALRDLGFRFVTVDLEGFRSGSLNQLVPLEVRQKFDSGSTP
ncbi:MAG: ATP-dependent sacrificial sulfur transferase LarE [Gemmataceae bacterium]|nr:ATP-dependent sacrificial sulfur transferase LarE [Gemmataceae bacterium]